jgi:hypothetical protein
MRAPSAVSISFVHLWRSIVPAAGRIAEFVTLSISIPDRATRSFNPPVKLNVWEYTSVWKLIRGAGKRRLGARCSHFLYENSKRELHLANETGWVGPSVVVTDVASRGHWVVLSARLENSGMAMLVTRRSDYQLWMNSGPGPNLG